MIETPNARFSERSPWSEYRELVLKELERLNDTLKDIQKDLGAIRSEVEVLKFKATMVGVIGGFVSGALVTVGAALLRTYSS